MRPNRYWKLQHQKLLITISVKMVSDVIDDPAGLSYLKVTATSNSWRWRLWQSLSEFDDFGSPFFMTNNTSMFEQPSSFWPSMLATSKRHSILALVIRILHSNTGTVGRYLEKLFAVHHFQHIRSHASGKITLRAQNARGVRGHPSLYTSLSKANIRKTVTFKKTVSITNIRNIQTKLIF